MMACLRPALGAAFGCVAAAMAACAASPAPAAPPLQPPRSIAPAAPPPAPTPEPPVVHFGTDDIETACNGVDDDGDGLIDVLLPLPPNACRTARPGACAVGFAACENGARVCFAPPPAPEVLDGVDNDCNGVVDDVPAAHVDPRAFVLAPRYAWSDAAPDIANVLAMLDQAGIAHDTQAPGSDWSAALGALDRYALAVVPGYLVGEATSAPARTALEQFARRGGVVVVFKPIGTADARQAWALAGLRGSTRRHDVLTLRFEGALPSAFADFDTPEERLLPINAPDAHPGAPLQTTEVYALDPDAASGTEVVAQAYGDAAIGPAITRRPVGRGAIYAFGLDMTTFVAPRCYINCFNPSGDLLRLFLEGALREATSGHVVLKHTVPGEASSALIVTHDVDAPDAENEGVWGPPGAIQAARLERERGLRATFNITTDYVAGYYNERTIASLCDLGMCPLGGHSVTHPITFGKLAAGTCTETRATYEATPNATPTLCGEVRVSRDLVTHAQGGRAPRVWRSPYLELPDKLFETLARNGFAYDSGFGIGDLPYDLPIDLATIGFHQNRFEHSALLEFPVVCEDGLDEASAGTHHRLELQASTRARFLALWRYILLENARNRSFTTLLLHPSRGRDMPPENLAVKLDTLAAFLDRAATADVVTRPLEEMGDFWRARLGASVDASYDGGPEGASYTGTLTTGATSAPGLTLEFGDAIAAFTCDACGEVRVHGKRVVLVGALPPGHKASFVARVR